MPHEPRGSARTRLLRSARALTPRRLLTLLRRERPPGPAREQPRPLRRSPDVTLVMVPRWGVERPPLNLAYLARYLREAGLRVAVRDFNVEAHKCLEGTDLQRLWTIDTEEQGDPLHVHRRLHEQLGTPLDRLVEELLSSDSPVIGFSSNVGNMTFVRHIASRVASEAPKRLLVMGGPDVHRIFRQGELHHFPVHYHVLGEGEETLLELARRHLAGRSTAGVPGTLPGGLLLEGSDPEDLPQTFVPRAPIPDLDAIPFPNYAQIDLSFYSSPEMPFLFSRGCLAACSFCADCLLQPSFRCRSGEHAVAEIEHHLKHYQRHIFNFNDLICNGDVPRLRRLCELIRRRRLDIAWSSYALVRSEMTADLFQLMHASGCNDLHFGLESGSDRVLSRMGKPFPVDLAERVIQDAARTGIRVSVNVVVGFPGETDEDVQATLYLLSRNQGAIYRVLNLSALTLMPGSRLWRRSTNYEIHGGPLGWVDGDGRDTADRLQSLERVRQHIESLGIPLAIINRGPTSPSDPQSDGASGEPLPVTAH